ncbi:MAG: flotillin-like FloA family protein, partial [Planctomycetota bacterium]
ELAEAEIPKAMADALRSGNLGVMDLYRLRNIDADTRMRGTIAGDKDSGLEGGGGKPPGGKKGT